MNGFSTKRYFDPNQLQKGMLISATYKTGVTKSGIIFNVTPELLQFTYFEVETSSFQNVDVNNEQVENGLVILNFSRHLTENKSQSESAAQGTKAQPQTETPSASIEELMKQYFPIDKFEKLERFIAKQRDAKVIGFILSRLNIPQGKFAKILFSLDDSLSLNVQKFLDAINNNSVGSDELKSIENLAKKLIQEYIFKQEQPKQNNPFGFGLGGGKNPLEDLLGGLGGGNADDLMNGIQDMASKMEDVIRRFLDDNNRNNRF